MKFITEHCMKRRSELVSLSVWMPIFPCFVLNFPCFPLDLKWILSTLVLPINFRINFVNFNDKLFRYFYSHFIKFIELFEGITIAPYEF